MGIWLSLAAVLSTINLSHCQCPRIPIEIKGQTLDVDRAVGVWYEYKYRDGPVDDNPSGTNTVNNGTILGIYPRKSGMRYITWYINFLYPEDDTIPSSPFKCHAGFQEGDLISQGGKRRIRVLYSEEDNISNITYTVLFTDYKLVQLVYRCGTPNANGIWCDEPFYWINTRIKPPLLTKIQKKYIENAADYYFQRICRKEADLASTHWDLGITGPPCDVHAGTPPIPDIFKASMERNRPK